jgi:2-polyprenyl-3-methyl-5-hydroxy-6-metoxy-1,4-benzoquinol methylase
MKEIGCKGNEFRAKGHVAGGRKIPILSRIARRLKKIYFLNAVSKDEVVLEIGCGDGWVGRHLLKRGVRQLASIDTNPPATIVGDIRDWRSLGLAAQTFDVIVAFEVLEHVDCMDDCFSLLKPGGRLLVTSPYPPADWFLKKLEKWKLNQPRTSPHDHLMYFEETAQFQIARMWRPLRMSQWCIFRSRPAEDERQG